MCTQTHFREYAMIQYSIIATFPIQCTQTSNKLWKTIPFQWSSKRVTKASVKIYW